MSREKIAVTISAENLAWLDENYDNRSGFINDLLTRARKGDAEIDRAVARYQKEQLRRERATLETQLEGVEEQLSVIESRIERTEQKRDATLEDALEKLQSVPAEPSNPAIQTQAEKLDMTPEELIEKVEEYGGDDE